MKSNVFDGRKFDEDFKFDWRAVAVGDVVIEGDEERKFRTLTDVSGKNWEYFGEDGYYHSTSPEFCHYIVLGQKCAGGKICPINYEN